MARVQPYYLIAVLPLLLLGTCLGEDPAFLKTKWAPIAVFCAFVGTIAPRLYQGRNLYIPDPDAFMPRVAAAAVKRDEHRILTVVHYDGTLLAYYLARQTGVTMDWSRMEPDGQQGFRLQGVDRVIAPLVFSHAHGENPEMAAEAALREQMNQEPLMVLSREGFHLEGVRQLLRRCNLLVQSGTGKLFRCPGQR